LSVFFIPAKFDRQPKGEIMKKTNILFLALAAALLATTSPASAAEKPSNYVLLKGGIYSPSSSSDIRDFNQGASLANLDSKTGFAGEVAVGHYFLPILAVELGAGYFQSKGAPATPPGETRLKVVPLVATGKVLLPLGIFEPYGLFGIGAYITDLDVEGNSGNFRGSTEITYGLHAGAGFNIDVHQNMFLGAEGKYLWAEPSFGGQHLNLDGFIMTADIGFRF
jgi:outer membrane protein W